MVRGVAALLVVLAGCDALFELEPVQLPTLTPVPACTRAGEAISLPISGDTFLDVDDPTVGHGADPLLEVDATRTPLVRFRTGGNEYAAITLVLQGATDAPGCATGADACEMCPAAVSGTFSIDVVASDWNEMEATYHARTSSALWAEPGALGGDVIAAACDQATFNGSSMLCIASAPAGTDDVTFAVRSVGGSSALFGSTEGSRMCGASPAPAAIATCARPASERCGDGIVQPPREACDDGNTIDNDACTNACANAGCGNGAIDAGEECDDGNANDLDGCTNLCTLAVCGDGLPNGEEECDDANTDDTDGCINCKIATCGDGITWKGVEQCDDGNAQTNDECIGCKLAACGDGFVHATKEICDDGNAIETDSCSTKCTMPYCGDGFVWDGVEECDDGNSDATDACPVCFTAYCGDGFVQAGFESCDDGNYKDGDGCSSLCRSEWGYPYPPYPI